MNRSISGRFQSLQTPRLVWGVVVFSVANYLLHLIPISLMSLFEWQPAVLQVQHPSLPPAMVNQVVAWMEFLIVSLLMLVCAETLALFVVFREVARLCIQGRSGLTVNASGYLLMFLGPLLAAAVPLTLLLAGNGAEELAAKLGIHMALFSTPFLTTVVVAFNVGYVLEPEAMQSTSTWR